MDRRLSPLLSAMVLVAAHVEACGDGDMLGDGGAKMEGSMSVADRCGDGTVSGSEQCDDGNTNTGDGCSSSCTREGAATAGATDAGTVSSAADAAVGSIDAAQSPSDAGSRVEDAAMHEAGATADSATGSGEADAATEDTQVPTQTEPLCPSEPPGPCEACNCDACRAPIDACTNLAGDATEGPAAGVAKATLCEALVRCGREKNCRGIECLCGTDPALTPDCLTEAAPPTGPCKDEVLSAAETTVVLTFITRASDPAGGYAIAAAKAVSDCAMSSCAEACAPPTAP